MKYLTDKEIINWNKRLETSDYLVYPSLNNRNSQPDVAYRQVVKNPGVGETYVNITEPFIRFKFIFSISSNREESFFELFKKISSEPFGTKSVYIGENQLSKISEIDFSEKIIDSKERSIHKISEKEYVRHTYLFKGKLGSIMAYVSYLEDAISFFSSIWGYEDNGKEVCLLKYPIGTIVSPNKDKSKDLLVLDYKYFKIYDKYYIDYQTSEMFINGAIITYGETFDYKEDELSFSRNQRIDNILN